MSDTYKYDPIITANGSHSPALSRFCTLVPAAFSLLVSASTSHAGEPGSRPARSRRVGPISSSSSSPLLSLVTSTSEISHQPVHSYTTYIWQWGRQNRKTGNVRKIQHLHEEREEEKFFNPQTMLHWGVQCENRKKTPQHKSTYTINTWLATGGHIQLWQAAVRSSSHLLRRRSQTCSTGGGTKRSEAVDRGGE